MKKTALITGASKGIGRELAGEFAKNGYSLILIARNLGELQQLQTEVKDKYACDAKIMSVDLSSPESANHIIDAFKDDMPEVEVLVNNAGFGMNRRFLDMPLSENSSMIEVNITSLVRLTYLVLPYMLQKKRGKILNVASTAAFAPGPNMAVYYASKAFVLSFSRALNEEYSRQGVVISTLCPGVTKTSFQARAGMENSLLASGILPVMKAEKVAKIAFKGLLKNKRVIIPGIMNRVTVFLMWLTPGWLLAKITGALEKPTSK
jgi:short-subunit dehydrogenase